jgi:hypothetical protein
MTLTEKEFILIKKLDITSCEGCQDYHILWTPDVERRIYDWFFCSRCNTILKNPTCCTGFVKKDE